MTAGPDFDTTLRSWLHGRSAARPDPYPIVARVMRDLPAASSRRGRWPFLTGSRASSRSLASLAAVVAAGLART
jgi:hypothetical protein